MPAFFRCSEPNYAIDCDNHKIINLNQIVSVSVAKNNTFFELHFSLSNGCLKWRYNEEKNCEIDLSKILNLGGLY